MTIPATRLLHPAQWHLYYKKLMKRLSPLLFFFDKNSAFSHLFCIAYFYFSFFFILTKAIIFLNNCLKNRNTFKVSIGIQLYLFVCVCFSSRFFFFFFLFFRSDSLLLTLNSSHQFICLLLSSSVSTCRIVGLLGFYWIVFICK